MSLTIEEIKDRLIERCDPDMLIEILEPDISPLVEACHDLIITNEDRVLEFLGQTDLAA